MIEWSRQGQTQQAQWRSEAGAPAPRRVVTADDTLPADTAYRMACEGTGLLWQGDFQNARHLLQALMRRTDSKTGKHRRSAAKAAQKAAVATPSEAFHLHRQAQAQRARVLASVLIPLEGDYSIALRRAPDWREACTQAWGPATGERSVATLRELLGLVGAYEWRKKGVEVPALGAAPRNRIHPHYGVFSPVRGEYVDLVASTPLPSQALAFDIGVGTGVLSAVLVRRGVQRVVATDQDPRALACAHDNLQRLGVLPQVELLQANLFPPGRAPLVVCNPPWAPRRATASIRTTACSRPCVASTSTWWRRRRCRPPSWPSTSAPAPVCWLPCWRAGACAAWWPPSWRHALWPAPRTTCGA